MADKKITALTELASTAKAGEDFLHIIDYGGGSSPVNKRISLTNLFSKINLDTHIYGVSKTFEIGSTDSASSALKVTTGSNTTLTTSIQNEVVVNDDQSRHIDFTVKSAQSAGAIKVESDYTSGNSGPGIVFINSDAGNQDFCVKGDNFSTTNPVLFSDASVDALGIGTNIVDATYQCTLAAVSGKSLKSAGTIDVTGSISATGVFSMSGVQALTCAAGANVVDATNAVTRLTLPASGTCTLTLPTSGLANGQIKIIQTAVQGGSSAVTIATSQPILPNATAFDLAVVGDSWMGWWDATASKWQTLSSVMAGVGS